jgi:hypothetical protein
LKSALLLSHHPTEHDGQSVKLIRCVDRAARRWHICFNENIADCDFANLHRRGDDDVDRDEYVQSISAAD